MKISSQKDAEHTHRKPLLPELTLFKLTFKILSRFGTMATALQLIPGLSMFFEMSSIVGAALWAAELERLEKRVTESNREL